MGVVRRCVFCLGMIAFNSVGIPISPDMSEPKAVVRPDDLAAMRKPVEKTLGGAERVARISASLLGLVCETDEIRVARIRAVVNDAIACMARDPKEDGIGLVVNLPDVSVAISPLKLRQVLLNLILNATQAMRGRGGKLNFAGHVRGDQVYIDVTDTGPGICDKLIDRLFEPSSRSCSGVPNQSKGCGPWPLHLPRPGPDRRGHD